MTIATTIHKDDIGTVFTITFVENGTAVDISGATTKTFDFEDPDATVVTQAGTFGSDGTNGILKYTTVSGDINKSGRWRIQGKIIMPSGTFKSSIEDFIVVSNLS